MRLVSAIVPGVMAQTGMETVEIIKGIVRETKPDMMIAVDALAARSSKRLNRTIQISDTGINPGSGVGNHRAALNKETLGDRRADGGGRGDHRQRYHGESDPCS